MPPEMSNLSGVGVAGLAIFLMYKLTSNHLVHLTKAIGDLTGAVKDLKEFLINHYQK